MRRAPDSSYAAAIAILGVALLLQLASIDYGTRINDVPEVVAAQVTADVVRGSGLERDVLVERAPAEREAPNLWWLRFKLYSIEADEVLSVLALQRIKRSGGDPGFYQYGGAYLYPLGAWFYALSRVGVLELSSLATLIADPQRMDTVWIFGRLFVLLAFLASAALLFATLRLVAPPPISLILIGLYLACPASIMFSQVMKPHWYALLWVNLTLLVLTSGAVRQRLTARGEVLAGLGVGLAVGSALTFAVFSLIVWGALVLAVRRKTAARLALVRVPAVAFVAFAATNPYFFLNPQAVAAERAALAGWFRPAIDVRNLWLFIDNSLLTGLGVALAALLIGLAANRLIRPRAQAEWLGASAILLSLLAVAGMTASLATWHVNLRYAAFVLPIGLLFLAAVEFRARVAVLAVVLTATLVQAVPLRLAYSDENDPARSTRLRAAAWINDNIAPGASICLGTNTLAPYEVPPFRFDLYELNSTGCTWRVFFERETESVHRDPDFVLIKRFRPRLSPEAFPLVFGHINPQISIYRRD